MLIPLALSGGKAASRPESVSPSSAAREERSLLSVVSQRLTEGRGTSEQGQQEQSENAWPHHLMSFAQRF